uniref:DUF1156 domain-containing protein n=1 Tax=Thermogemmatispora sp. TaxID=1968838 RepID=UPI0035E45C31
MTKPKKLIEVALPLEAINAASATEKSLRHGHPSTLHLWWSRKPLATARAVLFASLVDDPSAHPERFPDEASQQRERERLFTLLSELVQWKNRGNQQLWEAARAEILASTGGTPPPLLDPFAGGGSIPLEAQRLGLTAFAGDLNPVAVLINMALIEIPPRFAGQAPVHPQARAELLSSQWQGAHGLAADLRAYGNWLREEAQRRIGHLYPPARLPEEQGGQATVIAWLWARTVTCPNPACRARMPLVRTFWLSKRPGREAWIEPQVELSPAGPLVRFVVRTGKGQPPTGTVSRQGAHCIACTHPVDLAYIRQEGLARRMGYQCIAKVAESKNGKVYLPPLEEEEIISDATAVDSPDQPICDNSRWFSPPLYGLTRYGDLFTPRQLAALTTFSALVQEAHARVEADARAAGLPADDLPLQAGGRGPRAYADAVATYLALAVDRCADYWSSLCSWHTGRDTIGHTFTRQALPMVWDFAEANPFSASSGNFQGALDWVAEVVEALPAGPAGQARQRDALSPFTGLPQPLISTDPPYYDNVGYADLSDFFYLWLRRMLAPLYPDLFSTLLTPKQHELIATPYRFAGNKDQARRFFEEGLHQVFLRLRATAHPDYPLTIYYAFKQAELDSDETSNEPGESAAQAEPQPVSSSPRRRSGFNGSGRHNGHAPLVASTGWETMLQSLIEAGFTITGTWPMRTEMLNRSVGLGTNALASSIVLVCRPRPEEAPIATRKEFLRELRSQLPQAVRHLQRGGISPVDLAQASIGPGMAIYS